MQVRIRHFCSLDCEYLLLLLLCYFLSEQTVDDQEEDVTYWSRCSWVKKRIVNSCRRFYEWIEIIMPWLSLLMWIICCGVFWIILRIICRCFLKKKEEDVTYWSCCSWVKTRIVNSCRRFYEWIVNIQRPGGIPNIGASCYANSVFQVLGQTPGFMECLSQNCLQDGAGKIVATEHLWSLLNDLTFKSVVDYHKVHTLLNYIIQKDSSFSLGYQNDCHSFLLSLFNILKDEMNEGSLQLFEGKQCNVFSYSTCHHVENSEVQMFSSLLIPVLMTNYGWSVEYGLDTFFTNEYFANNVIPCRSCEGQNRTDDMSQTMTNKRTIITELPKILILQIARFKEVPVRDNSQFKTLEKINSDVQYTEYLNMSGFCEEKTALYRLYAVISHTGNLDGGHYYANVRQLKTDNWFYCSDSSIGSILHHKFKDKNAYVLLYERQQDGMTVN